MKTFIKLNQRGKWKTLGLSNFLTKGFPVYSGGIKWGTLAGNELKGHWHDVDQE